MSHRNPVLPRASVGETIEQHVQFTPEGVRAFALLAGDHNPMHHDETVAKASRFGGLIASGPQVSSMFTAMIATHYAKPRTGYALGGVLGLEFHLRFVKAVPANAKVLMRWEVQRLEYKPSLGGDLVYLSGVVRNDAEEACLLGEGTVLVVDKL